MVASVGRRLEVIRKRAIDDGDGKWDAGEILELADAARVPGTNHFEAEGRRSLIGTFRKTGGEQFIGEAKRTLRSILIEQAKLADGEIDASFELPPLHEVRTFIADGIEIHTHDSAITEEHAAQVGSVVRRVRDVFPSLAWPELRIGFTETAKGFYNLGPVVLAALNCEPPRFYGTSEPTAPVPRIGFEQSQRFLVHEIGHSLFIEHARGRLDLEVEGTQFGSGGLADVLLELNHRELDKDTRSRLESAVEDLTERYVSEEMNHSIQTSLPYQELVADLVAALVYRDLDVLTPGLEGLGYPAKAKFRSFDPTKNPGFAGLDEAYRVDQAPYAMLAPVRAWLGERLLPEAIASERREHLLRQVMDACLDELESPGRWIEPDVPCRRLIARIEQRMSAAP